MSKFVYGLGQILKWPVRWVFPVKVFGEKKIPKTRSIIVGNHLSGWDSVLFYAHFNIPICFMYKAEFRKSAFLRWAFDGLNFIAVRRGDSDITAIRSSIRVLKQDRILGLFPEGSRNPDVEVLQPLKTGAALFALKTRTPIRPFYVWDKGRPFRKNYYYVGEEFTLEQFYDKPITKELLNTATEYIREKMLETRAKGTEMITASGVKRRKRTKKELAKISQYYEKRYFAEQKDHSK